MCGIAGFFNSKNIATTEILELMTGSLLHRGPDAGGYYNESVDGYQVALGHRRLSIIDVSNHSNQPMFFEDLVLVYNGEVYNYAEIKQELQTEGYHFTTDGDTEVVLKALHKWGMQGIHKFRGMFALSLFDQKTKKIYLVRDRVGVKPLYYYSDNETLLFSSELKAFKHHPQFKAELCEHGMNLFFQYGYINAPWTIFKGAKKLRPGHYLEYDIKTHSYVEHEYWGLSSHYQLPKLTLNEQQATDQLEKILLDSFTLRMIADVPVGVLLSGGIDSSLVAALLQINATKSIETFTMGFDNQQYNEATYAKEIAKYLGTQHHEQVCTWKDAESIIAHLPKMYDEPLADPSAIPTALISKFVKEKVTVALSGDGGDELFCGYSSYQINEQRFKKLNKFPFQKGIKKLLDVIPDPIMGMYAANFDFYNRYLKLKSTFAHHSIEDKYKSITQTFSACDLQQLFFNNAYNSSVPNGSFNLMTDLERMMLVDFNNYLPDDLMVKVDRATMYYSLEGREPLLDHTILEFAAQLPIQLKKKKYILKKVLAKYIPEHYFERKKQGFGVPINEWLRKELHHLISKYLDVTKLKKQGIFNAKYVTALCQSFLRSSTNDNKIWTLLVFQMWYEEYFDAIF